MTQIVRLKKQDVLRPLFCKTDEAGRQVFIFISPKKIDEQRYFLLFFISSKTNEAPFLFILSIEMLIHVY